MLSSISPLGERARGNRFGVTATAHVVGATLGGAAAGALAGIVGAVVLAPLHDDPSTTVGLILVGGAAAVALVVDRRGVPSIHRQVDERWLDRYRGWVYGVGFGFQLGLGVVTIVPSAVVYATLVGAAATGSVAGGTIVGAVFGLARGAAILLTTRVRSPQALAALHRRVVAGEPAARRVAGAGATAIAVVAFVAAAVHP